MTTGNVSSAQMIAINMIKQSNTFFQDGAQADSFQSFMCNITESSDVSMKTVSDTQVTSTKTRDELTATNTGKEEVDVSKEDVEGLANDIKDAIKDTLEITDEELEQIMKKSEMGGGIKNDKRI